MISTASSPITLKGGLTVSLETLRVALGLRGSRLHREGGGGRSYSIGPRSRSSRTKSGSRYGSTATSSWRS